MKKSQTTSKSSVKAAKLPAGKKTGTPVKTAGKTLKKPAGAKAETKKKSAAKASAKKVPAKVKPASGSRGKASAKKSVEGKTTKPSGKTGNKKTFKVVKEAPVKISKTKAETKPVSAASVSKTKKVPKAPEIKKTRAAKKPVKKPLKTSEETKKTPARGKSKTITSVKSAHPVSKRTKKEPPAKAAAPITKTGQKTAAPAKKPSIEKAKKVAAPKLVEKPAKSIKARAGRAKTEKTAPKKKAKTIAGEKPLAVKTAPQTEAPSKQKETPKSPKKEVSSLSRLRKTIGRKTATPLADAVPLPETGQTIPGTYVEASPTVSAGEETKQRRSANLKIFLPEEELPPEEAQAAPLPKLPEEFGENELLLMEVDPAIVFVSWEIEPDCISCKPGKLTLRVYDVTGLDFDGSNANKFFDIALGKRVDSKFIDIKMPGRDVVMEIGLLQPDGSFEAIKRSNRVSMPSLRAWKEMGIGPSPESGALFGY